MQAAIKGLLAKEFAGAEAPPMVFTVLPPADRQDHLVEIADARAMQRGGGAGIGLPGRACVRPASP